jgi:MFS family permease
VPGGRLGDAFGRRGLFVAGLLVFIVGGFTAAGAADVWWVVAGRVIQGFGAGLISAQVLGVIQDLFAGPRRVRALAAYTSAGAAAALVGPLAAAALLTWLPPEWAWRAVLLPRPGTARVSTSTSPGSPCSVPWPSWSPSR